MDFSMVDLDDDVLAFWHEARAFFDQHVTAAVHAEEARTGAGFNEPLHLAMGERGWVVPGWSVQEGGADLDAVRRHLLAWEYRRSMAPGILHSTTRLSLDTIRRYAPADLAEEVLREVAAGRVRICLGYTEPDAGSDLAAVRTRATRDGDGWLITGQKMFTTGAQWSHYCFLLARTDPDATKHRGLTVFLVPLDTAGIEITPVATLGGETTNFVYYDDVRIPDRCRLGEVDQGWAVVQGALDAEHGLDDVDLQLGDAGEGYEFHTAMLLLAIERHLRAVGDEPDELMLERLGRAALDVERSAIAGAPFSRVLSAESLVANAATMLEGVGPTGLLVAGEDGATLDGLAEEMHRYAQGTTIYGGTTEVFRNMIAERVLGLPRAPRRNG